MDKTMESVIEPHTYEQLSKVFEYDAETGLVRWKIDRGRVKKGDKAATKHNSGYLSCEYDGVAYLVHRLAWLLFHKEWPNNFIDHCDLDKTNNKIVNLRLADRAGNSQNHPKRSDNTSGVKGVNWHKKHRRWCARIQADGRRYSLGYFDSIEEAETAILSIRKQLHKEFFNDGKKSATTTLSL